MPRLLGVEIPAKKKIAFSLRYIYGIGPQRADLIVKEVGLDPDSRAQDLTAEQLNKILAERTGQPLERIERDTERDYYMSAEESKEYGLIDQVISKRA